jgi:flavin reductase (DIM6/NTAB) family NADH-FMN oxidoreductase RutF
MRQWPSGVTVLTMPGEPAHGMTASAFTSVSIDPPMVLIVVDRRWRSHERIAEGGAFCVNILSEDMHERSDRFAGRHGPEVDRFDGVPTGAAVTGSPVMLDALAFLDCRVVEAFEAGDHTVFLGVVVACGGRAEGRRPLVYFDQRYARLETLPQT